MNEIEFDHYISRQIGLSEKEGKPPTETEKIIRDRFAEDLAISDNTLLRLVYAWRKYDSTNASGFGHCLEIIDFILQQAEQRLMLRGSLFSIKAEICQQLNEMGTATEMFANAVDELHALHLDVDIKRIYGMMKLGFLLLHQNKKQDAEKVFLDVLSYPWYLVMEADSQSLLREYHIKAAMGLIDCRRGKLEALKETFFVPAVAPILQNELDKAIAEARAKEND